VTYIVQADLENRLTARVVRQILDDDIDGSPDAGPLAQVIADAEAYCEGFVRGNYDIAALQALGVGAPTEFKRLCLDVAAAFLVERHPEYIRADGDDMIERARRDLMDLRNGVTRMNVVGSPENAANQGGIVRTGDPDDPTPDRDKVFLDPTSFDVF